MSACHEGVGAAGRDALDDLEVALTGRLEAVAVDPLDDRERRRLDGEAREEALDRVRPPVDLEHDAALVVAHEAPEPLLPGKAVDERAEPDALHDALDPGPHPRRPTHGAVATSTSSRSRCEAVAWASWIRGMCCERLRMRWSASPSSATRPPS